MFDQLYMSPVAVARHRSGPLLKERLAYACNSDLIRPVPARRRSKRSLITWSVRRNCRP
jgi:hypothetical protein